MANRYPEFINISHDDLRELVDKLHFGQKVERAKRMLNWAFNEYGDNAVVANSLGKDSMVVWDLAVKVNPEAKGFIVTTAYKPAETIVFMNSMVSAGL